MTLNLFFINCTKDEWNNNLKRLIQGLDPIENSNKKQLIKKRENYRLKI